MGTHTKEYKSTAIEERSTRGNSNRDPNLGKFLRDAVQHEGEEGGGTNLGGENPPMENVGNGQ